MCVSYLNKMFITNKNVKIILLGHIGYYSEYNTNGMDAGDFIPICKNVKIILNLPGEITNDVKNILDNTISNI